MSNAKIILNGIIKENPTFVLLLGMCPTLATTTSAMNGMMMGLATMVVLVFSNLVISSIRNYVPDMVHIPVYIVVFASYTRSIWRVRNHATTNAIKGRIIRYQRILYKNLIIYLNKSIIHNFKIIIFVY